MGFRRSLVRIQSPRHCKGWRDNKLRRPLFFPPEARVGNWIGNPGVSRRVVPERRKRPPPKEPAVGQREQTSRLTRGNGRTAHASASSVVLGRQERLVRRARRHPPPARQTPRGRASTPKTQARRSAAPPAARDRAGVSPPDGYRRPHVARGGNTPRRHRLRPVPRLLAEAPHRRHLPWLQGLPPGFLRDVR